MDISNKYLKLSAATVSSFFESEEKVSYKGTIVLTDFVSEFEVGLKDTALTSEKAVYLALQSPPTKLSSISTMITKLIAVKAA